MEILVESLTTVFEKENQKTITSHNGNYIIGNKYAKREVLSA